MEEFFSNFDKLTQFSWRNPWQTLIHVLDILLVAFLIYRILLLVRGGRAWRIVGGVIIFVLLLIVSNAANITALHWILDKATLLAPVALVILLLPELRAALEGVGKNPLWAGIQPTSDSRVEAHTVEEIVAAAAEMGGAKVGALIVIETGAPLEDIEANGVALNANVSAALLGAIFYEGNPLHDGAVLIRQDRIAAAACRLPLSESSRLDSTLHMRHRAAVGITEQRDAICVVVSEERGIISLAVDGRLRRMDSPNQLRDELNHLLRQGNRSAARRLTGKKRRARESGTRSA